MWSYNNHESWNDDNIPDRELIGRRKNWKKIPCSKLFQYVTNNRKKLIIDLILSFDTFKEFIIVYFLQHDTCKSSK